MQWWQLEVALNQFLRAQLTSSLLGIDAGQGQILPKHFKQVVQVQLHATAAKRRWSGGEPLDPGLGPCYLSGIEKSLPPARQRHPGQCGPIGALWEPCLHLP